MFIDVNSVNGNRSVSEGDFIWYKQLSCDLVQLRNSSIVLQLIIKQNGYEAVLGVRCHDAARHSASLRREISSAPVFSGKGKDVL